jgi:hypothetical protein
MFYWPSAEEGLAWLEACDTSWAHRAGQDGYGGWYIGTGEYEEQRREAETLVAELFDCS